MSQRTAHVQRAIPTQEELKRKLAVSNFHPDAILRGAQLTVVGGKNNMLAPSYARLKI